MNHLCKKLLALGLLLLPTTGIPAYGNAVAVDMNHDQEWNFRVFLDDAEIGYHNFRLTHDVDSLQLTTSADFKVKFLFITAYRYRHNNRETWQNGCLREIESSTDANGKAFEVSGSRENAKFNLEVNTDKSKLGDCVKTFAYWNPDFLQETELLNAQTGELLNVIVSPAEEDVLTIGGRQTAATKYHLTAKNVDLNVWYSDDQRWLALESTVKGGRKLRYELNPE